MNHTKRRNSNWRGQAFARLSRDEHGFSMVTAITALMVGTLLSLAAWATANSDITFTDRAKWDRVAHQRAQSGISDYVQHLAEDSGFWKACDRPDGVTGNGLGQTALNDNDFGATDHPKRRWLPWATPGTATDRSFNTQYTIDLQPRTGSCKPSATAQDRMIDPASGTFRVAVTGRAGPLVPANIPDSQIESWRQKNWKRVTLVAEYRRNGFLDYGYFTDKEGMDPAIPIWGGGDSCDAYYQDDPGQTNGRWRNTKCTEIQFANSDYLRGPFHSNDSIKVESLTGPQFGLAGKGDRIEVYDNGNGNCPVRDINRHSSWNNPATTSSNCYKSGLDLASGATFVPGPAARYLDLPQDNQDLILYADPYSGDPESRGYTFYGKTTIVLNDDKFVVTNALVNGGTPTTYDFPTSGVIWVANNGVSSCTSSPYTKKYSESITAGCAVAEVEGTYSKSLTIGSAADVVITANIDRSTSSQTAVLGLIAQQYVRVRHYRASSGSYNNYGDASSGTCSNDSSEPRRPRVSTIRAAILALQHSFTVDGYSCGASMGTLNFTGALAQRFRGVVGQGSAGYSKNYIYDYTFKSQTPPHFLSPSAATWKIIRMRQTLPACLCKETG